jgi:metal-responsive CopG/Arc/MetJ family transcriptional regulator
MARMQRTQVYLPADLSAALDRVARREGTTRASLIRRAAQRLLESEQLETEDPILGLIGLGNGGPGRVSETHDEVLAETARKA